MFQRRLGKPYKFMIELVFQPMILSARSVKIRFMERRRFEQRLRKIQTREPSSDRSIAPG